MPRNSNNKDRRQKPIVVIEQKHKNKNKSNKKSKGDSSGIGGMLESFGKTAVKSFVPLAFDFLTGMGDYKVKRNSLHTDGHAPMFLSKGGGVDIAHREFLTDILGSVDFAIQKFTINPGIQTTFPFLALIAQNFEEFDLMGIVFEFRTSSGSAVSSSSAALGTVIFATNYDVEDKDFTSKQQMEAYEFATSCAANEHMIHPVECMKSKNVMSNLFIRAATENNDGDPRFYDLGNFYVATQGMQSAYNVGELWVSYHVRLIKPKLVTDLPSLFRAPPCIISSTQSTVLNDPIGANPLIRSGFTTVNPAYAVVDAAVNVPGTGVVGTHVIQFHTAGRYFISAVIMQPGVEESTTDAVTTTVYSFGGDFGGGHNGLFIGATPLNDDATNPFTFVNPPGPIARHVGAFVGDHTTAAFGWDDIQGDIFLDTGHGTDKADACSFTKTWVGLIDVDKNGIFWLAPFWPSDEQGDPVQNCVYYIAPWSPDLDGKHIGANLSAEFLPLPYGPFKPLRPGTTSAPKEQTSTSAIVPQNTVATPPYNRSVVRSVARSAAK